MSAVISNGTTEVTPLEVLGFESSRESRNIIHQVLGSESPSVTLRAAGLRSGTLVLLFNTLAEAVAAEVLHSGASVLTLAFTGLDELEMSYVSSGSITVRLDDETRALWLVEVEFQEVSA